jgi:squalene-hopene/tetraprenyl-beta-curcumene cyclase
MIARSLALSLVLAGALPAFSTQDDARKRLEEAYGRAADGLVSQQDASGAWKMGPPGKEAPSPSYTALMLVSFANAPAAQKERLKAPIEKAQAFLLSKANADGSFGEGPSGTFLKTYTTALSLMALSSVERTSKVADAIRGAQSYLKQNQLKEGLHKGGVPYGDDGKPGEAPKGGNLSLTGFASEGMKASGLPQDDEFWKLVVEFVRKCQNSSEVNKDPEYLALLKKNGLSLDDQGGLYYQPTGDAKASPAGTRKIADREVIASYGAMTYDGIKTYIYAGLPKDSPEVKAAVDWVRKNYSLEVHPGFAYDEAKRGHLRGLFYYYVLMARALDAYGENPFVTFDGKKHDWPREMAEQFLKSIQESKLWKNANSAWYEGDPVLVTSYVLITCDVLFKHLK